MGARMTYKKASEIVKVCNKFIAEEKVLPEGVTFDSQGIVSWWPKAEPVIREMFPEFDDISFSEIMNRMYNTIYRKVYREVNGEGVTE